MKHPPPAHVDVQWAPWRHPTRPWESYGPVDWDPAKQPPAHRTEPYIDLEGTR